MRKTIRVMRQELFTTFTRPSFVIVAFVLPVVAVLIVSVVQLVQTQSGSDTSSEQAQPYDNQIATEGYVDYAGLIRTLSPNLQGVLIPFETEAGAIQALEAGEITAYYVIPKDYLAQGDVDYIFPDDRSYLSDGQKWVIQWTLVLNMLGGDLELADQVWNPVWNLKMNRLAAAPGANTASGEDCSQPGSACRSNELVQMMPSILAIVFFIAFMNSSSMLFNSIGTEKENRTIELLMMLVRPVQLLVGKTLALGFAGLCHTAVWLGAMYILLNAGGTTLNLPENFQFPVRIVAWGLVFFICGFGLYASLMAGAGALVPRLKEAGVASYLAMAPLFLGYAFGLIAPLAGQAGSGLLVFLSIFPLTSPVVMVMRLTDHFVPAWQIALSIVLLLLAVYYTLRTAAAMFHTRNLLSGQPFSARRYMGALIGRSSSRS